MTLWYDLIHVDFFYILRRDCQWIIIALMPTQGLAYLFDLNRDPQKCWNILKESLNDDLCKCRKFKETFTHHSEFKFITSAYCHQEPNVKTCQRSGYCAMAIMDDILKKSQHLRNHSQIIKWFEEMERYMDIWRLLREHEHLQKVWAKIINKKVVNEDVKFHS